MCDKVNVLMFLDFRRQVARRCQESGTWTHSESSLLDPPCRSGNDTEILLLCRLPRQDSATMHVCPSDIEKSQLIADLGRNLLAIKLPQGEVSRSHSHEENIAS
jgi:hypothetical protein